MKRVFFLILCGVLLVFSCGAKERKKETPTKVVAKSWVGAGLFAELKHVIYNLIYRCDHINPKRLVVDWTQPFFPYKDDPSCNGWDLYFEPIRSDAVHAHRGQKRPPEPKHDKTYCVEKWLRYPEFLSYRRFMHDKIQKYIAFKPKVRQDVDAFYETHLKGHFCIGIHVRFATAHGAENPYHSLVSLEDYICQAKKQFEAHQEKNPKIFLATDSNHVIEEFKRHFNASQLCFTSAFRATFDEDPHLIYEHQKYYLEHPEEFHQHKPGFFGGLMALVDCLLLSRCEVMIHSLSNVSDFAAWFNPEIKSIFLPVDAASSSCRCEKLYQFFEHTKE